MSKKGVNELGQFTFRIPEEIHAKARVLAAYKNLSLNEVCIRAVESYIRQWEDIHGELPLPPDDA